MPTALSRTRGDFPPLSSQKEQFPTAPHMHIPFPCTSKAF